MIVQKIMYKGILRFIFLAMLMLSFIASCTDNFSELNTPKDRISTDKIDASLLGPTFAGTEYHAMETNFQICQSLNSDLYSQYFSSVATYFTTDNLVESGGYSNSCWHGFYEIANQIHFVEEFTANHDMNLRNAIVRVWKVHSYQRITDYWGPIIYSAFGNGENSVAYDSQQKIYDDFFKELDDAVKIFKQNMGKSAFTSDDIIYGGNIDKWLKFANSLRLRMAMRIRFVTPKLAKKEAEKAVNTKGGVMMDNSDNAMVSTNNNSKNPINAVVGYGEFNMSATMESYLEGFKDPRIGVFFSPAKGGDSDGDGSPYEGIRNGLPAQAQTPQKEVIDNHSRMGPKWRSLAEGGTNPPIKIMQTAEVYFLRAEGALVGWDMGGTAKEFYNEGIRMSMKENSDATDTEITAYIHNNSNKAASPKDQFNSPPVSSLTIDFDTNGSKEKKLQQIITQKWIALYPNGWEAWAELRRTGYPELYPRIDVSNSILSKNDIIRRLTFTSGEQDNNTTAAENAIKLLDGPDEISTRVWWDVKKEK